MSDIAGAPYKIKQN